MGILKRIPFFIILLPCFFVLHGYVLNYSSIPLCDALLLTVLYIAVALFITSVSWFFFRDATKAAIFTFALMGFNFFFGRVQDVLRNHFGSALPARYTFILPVSGMLFVVLIVFLKKRKLPLNRTRYYFNLLFILLLVLDLGWLTSKIVVSKKKEQLPAITMVKCDTCRKPDVYFILLDEYAGNMVLKDKFGFDNSGFQNELRSLGFHVNDSSTSNYNFTPFSLASMLNMSYLDLNMKTKGAGNLQYCYQMIRDSKVIKLFESTGYKIYNYSIFDLESQPAISTDNFLPTRTRLITAQTFLSRAWDDVLFNVNTGKWGIGPIKKRIVYSHLKNNENFIKLTSAIAKDRQRQPKFVYTHLLMPHYPYFFDSRGNALPFDSLVEGKQASTRNYIEYLQYCNKKILALTNDILKNSASPPIIILTGDHGFRQLEKREDRKYLFMNLSAVYLPSGNYGSFYDRISCVNLFPAILNGELHGRLPMQRDSSVFLWE